MDITEQQKPRTIITNGEQQQITNPQQKTARHKPRSSYQDKTMAAIVNNNPDDGRHLPTGVETGLVEKLTKTFRGQHGTFSDLEGENIVIFAKNADKFMS